MKLFLNVGERVTLHNTLMAQENKDIEELIKIQKQAKMFELDKKEKEQVGYKETKNPTGTTNVHWDDESYKKEYDFDAVTITMVIGVIEKLVKEGKITAGNLLVDIYARLNEKDEPKK